MVIVLPSCYESAYTKPGADCTAILCPSTSTDVVDHRVRSTELCAPVDDELLQEYSKPHYHKDCSGSTADLMLCGTLASW